MSALGASRGASSRTESVALYSSLSSRAAFARADIATAASVIVFVINLSLRSLSRSKSALCPAAIGFNGAFLCFELDDLSL